MRFLLLLVLSGCSLFFGEETSKSAKGYAYTINFQASDWVLKKDERSDYIFEHKTDGRIFLSNSFCEEFQDQPLDRLAMKTFRTVDRFKPQSKDYTTFNKREAYRVSGSGEVDGVKVNLRLLNTRRNNCYFDFLAIDPTRSDKDVSFEAFLRSVVFK